jgi:hypothetical protein
MAEVIEGDDDDLEDGFVLKMMVKSQKDKNLLIQIDAIHIPVHISGRNEVFLNIIPFLIIIHNLLASTVGNPIERSIWDQSATE